MDDVHRSALLHPGPVIWSAVLIAGAEVGAALSAVLDGAVQGYESMIAVGSTLDALHYSHFHNTATTGPFGSAAAAGSVYELSACQLLAAMGNAASTTGGLWQFRAEQVMTKFWHTATASSNGKFAAYMAKFGMTGPAAILEGPQGLYAATCRDPKPLVLGDGWRIEEVSFKPWAACRHAHPAIDCALELRAAGRVTPPFHVETYADALTFCDRPDPVTETDAKFSLQHAVAVIADGRDATPADFTPEAIAALALLRAQVSVAEDPEITARYPAHFGARVNGLELQDCRGDPERPVGEAEIVAKMHMLAAWGGLPASEADRAAELALRGDDAAAVVTMLEEWLA
ncbi:MmgE/PrpD family protein [Sphingomonas antarctica]|uniref:MmgE/PrpD family protein n=1 Tax=Sphingomonas antarctica TaxID=2040274 RepID=UPI0039EBD151